MELPDGPGFDRLCRDIANAPYAELTDDQRAANVLKAFEPLRDVAPTASTGDVARDLNGRGFRVRVPELHIAVDVGVGKDRTVRVVHDRADAVKDTATISHTANLWLLWSDPAFVRERFGGLAPGSYCLAKPTVAVMREAADGVEAGRLRVTIDGDYLRVFRHVEAHTDPGDGLGLPLVCTDPAGLDGCRFCSPRSGATGECESHRRAHAELDDELAAEAARDECESDEESEER